MSPLQENLIRRAIDGIRQDHPKLYRVLSATQCARNLSEARRALTYFSVEAFTADYHQALLHLVQRLQDEGYESPSANDRFEDRITWQPDKTGPKSNAPKLPSPEIVERWYKGHILHEALSLIAKQSFEGLKKLWNHFPHNRTEIEIAFALAKTRHIPAPSSLPIAGLPTPNTPSQPNFLPFFAGAFALGILLLLSWHPPQGARAINAIATSFDDAVFSAQGIFDFSESALAEAEAPGAEPEPPPAEATRAPEPPPRPEIALPARPKIEMASLPKVTRQLDLPTTRVEIKTPPRVSAPNLAKGNRPSTFFGSRPDVKVARPNLSMPAKGPSTLPTPGAGSGRTQANAPAESADLKGYRPAGRIGFSSFQTSRSLASELVRLTRIERALSRLKKTRTITFDRAQLTLIADKAQIQFPDGIAFTIAFRFGRLDDIQIFTRSGTRSNLDTETEALRGIRLLDRALSKS